MRLWYAVLPVVAVATWFACGKLATKRNDSGDSSGSTQTTETDTASATDTATDTATEVVEDDGECLAIGKIDGEEAYKRFADLNCNAKARACKTDADCTYGGAGGCDVKYPVNVTLADLVGSAHGWADRTKDCIEPKNLANVTSLCRENSCAGQVTLAKKDGTTSDCIFGFAEKDCKVEYACDAAYFGSSPVDIRDYASPDDKCANAGARPNDAYLCYSFPQGNGDQQVAATYQWAMAGTACHRFSQAAAQ